MDSHTRGEPASDRSARIQNLLAAAHSLAASLESISSQLCHEVADALTSIGGPEPTVAALQTENRQLKDALEGRAVIERAKGMLMARHRCEEEDAFRMLVSRSRQERRKVREIAADLVATARSGTAAPAEAPSIVSPLRPA
ncbi:ANTAR domain-containing response regulator [Streptacidiphilus griseoplanus]|uniref:ANTAR domain-containing response regulator n=1 Tax=Peterkaempfera griseoplana TaxID=66896 RepID=UPI0012FEBC1F|nr:ANTAR domain-containing protein [Peterkaempfera griseoplana]